MTTTTEVRKLSEQQQAAFDHDYVSDEAFDRIALRIDRDLDSQSFRVLDVGGGKGLFADAVLQRYAGAHVTVLDNSELLLSQNTSNPRKELLLASGTQLEEALQGRTYDLICFNFVLHHFVAGRYAVSRALQLASLMQARRYLSPRGCVSVSEIAYNGILLHNLPSRIVYFLTSSATLAPLTKRLGANTAGCGVCFLSAAAWRSVFRTAGFTVAETAVESRIPLRLLSRLRLAAVGAGDVRKTHFWLRPCPR